jgi:glycyl-tRNA synthetase (class II)
MYNTTRKTIRERDSMKQERVNIADVPSIIEKRVSFKNLLMAAEK